MPAADPERALDAMPAIEQTMLFTVRWIQTGSSSGARHDASDRAAIRATMLSQLRQDLRAGSGAQRSTRISNNTYYLIFRAGKRQRSNTKSAYFR